MLQVTIWSVKRFMETLSTEILVETLHILLSRREHKGLSPGEELARSAIVETLQERDVQPNMEVPS